MNQSTTTDNRYEARENIDRIKAELRAGTISYDDAKAAITEQLKTVNARGAQIAKKYGKRYRPITAQETMR